MFSRGPTKHLSRLGPPSLSWLLLVLVGLPMLWVVGYSLAYSLGLIGLFSDGFTFKHWQACLSNHSAGNSLIFSVTVAAISTSLAMLVALCVVMLWPRCGKSSTFMAIVCLGLGTPAAVMALMVNQWLGGGGWLSRLAWHMGLIAQPNQLPSLAGDRFALGIILTQVLAATPLLLLFFSQMWMTIKGDRLCELAGSLGASTWQIKRAVAAPMLLTRARSMVLLTFMFNLGSYEVPLLLGRQSPQMLSVLTQRRTGQFDVTQRPESFALATLYFLLTSLLLGVYLTWRRRHAT